MKENENEETNNEIKDDLIEEKQEKKKPAKGNKKFDKKANDEIEALGNKLIELNDKYLRISAEFDNYRKRTLKEKTDLLKTASADVITSLLPVLDDFERALKSFENTENNPVCEGVRLIYNKFRDNLTQKGLKEIEAVNLEFNTDIHEAITKIPAPTPELKGKVVDVVEKGYYLYDKVIRYSKVVVGE